MLVLHCWSKQLLWRRETSKSRNGLLKKSDKYFFFLVWHTKAQKLSCPVIPVAADLQIHGLQHTRLPCPSLSPSLLKFMSIESVMLLNYLILCCLLLCLQSFPASGSFLMSRLFTSDRQSTGGPASASDLSMNIQDWFPLGLTGLISLLSKGLSRIFSSTHSLKTSTLPGSATQRVA